MLASVGHRRSGRDQVAEGVLDAIFPAWRNVNGRVTGLQPSGDELPDLACEAPSLRRLAESDGELVILRRVIDGDALRTHSLAKGAAGLQLLKKRCPSLVVFV